MIKRFAIKFILFTLPFSLVTISYFVLDPFKVLYKYNDFYTDFYANVDRDYASSRLFVHQYDTCRYDSFIFGSSRTLAFPVQDWRTHLAKSAKPYKFDAFSETLTGICSKIIFLDKKNVEIKNALVILCPDVTFDKIQKPERVKAIKDPEVEGEYRYLNFQMTFFSSYLEDYFFVEYLKKKFVPNKKETEGIHLPDLKVDAITNDLTVLYWERELARGELAFYQKRDSVFYKRSGERKDLPG